uniref:Uncharacterized protein n=1 Tax=Solanum lycopersicum TaxID=4081 RepID=A0A3Q7EH03_SOLLC
MLKYIFKNKSESAETSIRILNKSICWAALIFNTVTLPTLTTETNLLLCKHYLSSIGAELQEFHFSLTRKEDYGVAVVYQETAVKCRTVRKVKRKLQLSFEGSK